MSLRGGHYFLCKDAGVKESIYILAEIGSVENEEEEYKEHEEVDEILYLDDHGIAMNVTTRSGSNATRFLLC